MYGTNMIMTHSQLQKVNVNTWDDYNNYLCKLISIGMFNKYVQQFINYSIVIMMWDKLILVHQQKNY
jgi:hypothetical protein